MKKNPIDQVFKDRLRDYQEAPDERVWESIAASLDKKKSKRRVFPIWWKLGGAAAALALLLYFVLPIGSGTNAESITDTEQPAIIASPESPAEKQDSDPLRPEDSDDGQLESPGAVTQTDPAEEGASELKVATRGSETPVVKSGDAEESQLSVQNRRNVSTVQTLAMGEEEQEEALTKKEVQEVVAEEARIADRGAAQKDTPLETENGKGLKVGIAANTTDKETQEDSMNPADKKSIFEVIEDQEEEVVSENKTPRWSVGPMVAPVYFNTLAEGSPIHSNFVANTKSGNVNLSYGLAVSYQVSRKLSVRSGVHRVDYGYNTDEIRFSSSLTASTSTLIDNIDYDTNSRTLVVESQASRGAEQNVALDANEVTAPSPAREGRMVQDFGYLEVPVELHYRLLDRKVGINVIGGVSSLFLTGNSVTLVADNTSTAMGEANNLNEVNFSTNLGLGLFYRVTPKMQVNLEPMFKYQLNTFSDAAGNFQPFSLGVYSGLSFKF